MIPARGGSSRIPRKNIRPFHGKPIIAYSVETAKNSGLFDQVIVSTDDAEIASVAQDCGAEAPFQRPAAIADAHSSLLEVIQHTLDWYEAQGTDLECLCCIMATAPLISGRDLERGYQAITEEGFDSAFAAAAFNYPIQRALRMLPGGGVELMQPEHLLTRSQDLEAAYHDAGQFYWVKPGSFSAEKGLFSAESKAIVIPSYRVQDIDTEEDWERAELLYQVLGERDPGAD